MNRDSYSMNSCMADSVVSIIPICLLFFHFRNVHVIAIVVLVYVWFTIGVHLTGCGCLDTVYQIFGWPICCLLCLFWECPYDFWIVVMTDCGGSGNVHKIVYDGYRNA